MTTTIPQRGRLGNQIFRNIAVTLIAEKHDLNVIYGNANSLEQLGIKLYIGKNVFDETISLNDDNYVSLYNAEILTNNLDPTYHYFQSHEVSKLIYNYLNAEVIKTSIIENNPFRSRYNANNDVYIHIRLTDVARWNPGFEYYMNAITSIEFDNIYISTDQPRHHMIQRIKYSYPAATILDYNEIQTFQFASTCKNIILSHGSFSAIIGYLAFFSNVHYAAYDRDRVRWCGDMFTIDGWIKHDKP